MEEDMIADLSSLQHLALVDVFRGSLLAIVSQSSLWLGNIIISVILRVCTEESYTILLHKMERIHINASC